MQSSVDAVQQAVRVLNEALEADADAMVALMAVEVSVNQSLAEHPSIQVGWSELDPSNTRSYVLRPLGLINGLFGVDKDDWGFIAMEVQPGTGEFFDSQLDFNGGTT